MPFKDKEKQKASDRERSRRYRASHPTVTPSHPENHTLQSIRKPMSEESQGLVPTALASDGLHKPIVIVKMVRPSPVKPNLDADGNIIPEYW